MRSAGNRGGSGGSAAALRSGRPWVEEAAGSMARPRQEAVAVPSLGGVGRERFLRDIYPQVWPRERLGSGLGCLRAA